MVRTRNFYGALEIRDVGEGESAVRALYSGRTIHGLEFLSPARRRTPTTYYGVHSGVGLVLESLADCQPAGGHRGPGRRHFGHLRQERRFLPLLRNQPGSDPCRRGVFRFPAGFSGRHRCCARAMAA